MIALLRPCLSLFLLLTIVTGVIYPAVVTLVAGLAFPHQAGGSLILRDGVVIGSSLIGQPFTDPGYLWGRPSATGPFPDNAASSNASNLGPTNPDLSQAVTDRVSALIAADPSITGAIPADLVTTSGSGLDPDLSPAGAMIQASRIARTRGIGVEIVRRVIESHLQDRQFGILGEPRVNVLAVNLDLDKLVHAR